MGEEEVNSQMGGQDRNRTEKQVRKQTGTCKLMI